ncbi:hypothetical protein [Scytonema sp. UIC 10036]|uniref:hypothetical protein n=1 Tax=Scytonema sp. UIC 10036 TaxID=2304196 RepID=UPI001FA9C5B2|nr:hypothetical protein [Scytonema sp. UIC 10036]
MPTLGTAVAIKTMDVWKQEHCTSVSSSGTHGESWQHYDGFILNAFKQWWSKYSLRQLARVHENCQAVPTSRTCLREFRLNELVY